MRNEKGFTFVELMAAITIVGILTVAALGYIRASRVNAVGSTTQVAMVRLAMEDRKSLYPASALVTVANLNAHGALDDVLDYVIPVGGYVRTGTPVGSSYTLQFTVPDASTLCVTPTSVTKAAC